MADDEVLAEPAAMRDVSVLWHRAGDELAVKAGAVMSPASEAVAGSAIAAALTRIDPSVSVALATIADTLAEFATAVESAATDYEIADASFADILNRMPR